MGIIGDLEQAFHKYWGLLFFGISKASRVLGVKVTSFQTNRKYIFFTPRKM
jgi:hypothetical protein